MNDVSRSSEKSTFGPKQIIICFLLVLIAYMSVYHWVEYRRHFKGPWQLGFETNASGQPTLTIHQPKLNLTKQIQLNGESWHPTFSPSTNMAPIVATNDAGAVTVAINRPGLDIPFGRIIYEDLTFLPGVVTLDLFGHEIEMMPRVLLVNKKEVAWNQVDPVVLRPDQKPEIPPAPPKGSPRDEAGGY